jgi:hypothetical protein
MANAHPQDGGAAPAAAGFANIPPGLLGQAIQAELDALKSVRAAATSWAATVSALVGISTILGLLKGSDALAKLSVPTQIFFAVTFFLTLAFAVASVIYAALASQGTPQYQWSDPDTLLDKTGQSLKDATSQLQTSRRLALIAVIFLALAIFFSLFDLFGSGPAGTTVLAVQRSGSVVCGTLTKAQAGQVSLTNNGQSITLNDVISLTVVPSCPK